MQPFDQYDPNQPQEDIRKPYASILVAVFAIVGGIALIYFSMGVFSSFTGGIENSGIHVQHVMQDTNGYGGYAGYQPESQAASTALKQECKETNSCDECLSLLSGRSCDCDKECASLRCVENRCG